MQETDSGNTGKPLGEMGDPAASKVANLLPRWFFSRIGLANWFRGRYMRALENEVARLRAENRALVNSILGIAGMPPMLIREAERANAAETPVLNTHEIGENSIANAEGGRFGTSAEGRLFQGETAAPVRRRSWQQIGRALEIGDARAARLARESDTDAFPAPRNVVPRA